ncbi:WXG100 family type VII secretion target [Streptomyces sp. URMC 123]|uniref:WXG100 family type VII secretion target n=1 Tax=Streptomyces sp. URMC 123 TaxID=3423403 RepID=UPI003F1A0CAB
MSSQSISYEAFQKFENAISTTSTHFSTNLKNLANTIATVQAGWKGDGAAAFTTAQRSLNEDHDALRRLIDGIHDAVITTRRMGSNNDAEVLASFKSIDVNGAAAGGHLAVGQNNLGGVSDGLSSKISSY